MFLAPVFFTMAYWKLKHVFHSFLFPLLNRKQPFHTYYHPQNSFAEMNEGCVAKTKLTQPMF
jgi:hypothetical protein